MKNTLYQMVHSRWETLRDAAENLAVSLNSQLTQERRKERIMKNIRNSVLKHRAAVNSVRRVAVMWTVFTLLFGTGSGRLLGQELEWAKRPGGTSYEEGNAIAVDGSGNSYVTGFFLGMATFDGTTLTSAGGGDIFVAKYDASGNVLWAKSAGGGSFELGSGIAVDGSGNSYVTGFFQVAATFDGTTLASAGDFDIFVAKYDASGNVVWAKRAGGTGDDQGQGIAVDGSGNSYVTGSFASAFGGTATFDGITLTSAGFSDIFVAKYDASGNVVWAKRAGGTNNFAFGIAVDGLGNSYVTGRFFGTATFDGTTLPEAGFGDIFVAKYDASGNVVWAKSAGGTSIEEGRGIAVDGSGNSYVTGWFFSTATFDGTTLTNAGSADIFVAKYDPSGNVLWAKSAGGGSFDLGNGIAVDGSGNSYVTGYFQGAATFDGTPLASAGDFDIFVAKYDASGNLVWAKSAGGTGSDFSLAIAVDGSGNSYVTGHFQVAATFDGTTLISAGNFDIFVAKYGAPRPQFKCPLTQGFWKNHPDAWPDDSLKLGTVGYSQAQLLNILNTPVGGKGKADASLILAHQLIAAKLNIANGSDPAPITGTIAQADGLIGNNTIPMNVRTNTSLGQQMTSLAETLDSYNNGALTPDCVPSTASQQQGSKTQKADVEITPTRSTLEQNYPNPFNPTTTIEYHVPVSGLVKLSVFDILGREIAVLVNENVLAGKHRVTFDASSFAAGLYFYRIQAGQFQETRKLVLLK